MRKTVVLLALLALACEATPVSTNRTSNPGLLVELLFEHDGCRVYRFRDNGNLHYYAHCGSQVTAWGYHKSGKSTVREEISTDRE